jgi:hypothetical protein
MVSERKLRDHTLLPQSTSVVKFVKRFRIQTAFTSILFKLTTIDLIVQSAAAHD